MGWSTGNDKALKDRARAVIPNGMFGHQSVGALPEDYPQFFTRAEGAHLWDSDGNRYLDFMCGYGPNLFGYGHESINAAYIRQLQQGDTMTGPAPVMVDLAEALVAMVAHADWAIFCKNGTDATTMAVTIARQHTSKNTIILAKGAYHGAAPWCTPVKNGTTPQDRANQIFCDYNDVESLEAAVREAGTDLAAIIASPIKHDTFVDQQLPLSDYARRARELCDEHGALLIVDDVRAGFRLARDCSWSLVGIEPDLSCWGKAIANGHPLSALLGSDKARQAAGSIYVTGSYWFSAAPLAASVETLRLIRESDYLTHTGDLGSGLRAGLAGLANLHGIGLKQSGPVTMPLILFEDDPGFARGYFFVEQLLKRGIYFHPWHNMFICNAMTQVDIDATLNAADEAFAALAAAGPLGPVPQIEAMFSRRAR
jgi:glutamate-1-semialdehyde 2,1-aminomutase